jgi:chemotaxis protein CheX
MRAEHVNPFIKAVQLVFETMLGTKVTVSKPELKADDKLTNDVTGIIGLSGEVVGSAALSFPLETAKKAVEAFSGSKLTETDDLFSDAVGELANMVTGNAKKDLDDSNIYISVHTVVIGKNHRLGHHQLGPWVVLRCQSNLGPFTIEICVVEVAALAASGGKA